MQQFECHMLAVSISVVTSNRMWSTGNNGNFLSRRIVRNEVPYVSQSGFLTACECVKNVPIDGWRFKTKCASKWKRGNSPFPPLVMKLLVFPIRINYKFIFFFVWRLSAFKTFKSQKIVNEWLRHISERVWCDEPPTRCLLVFLLFIVNKKWLSSADADGIVFNFS